MGRISKRILTILIGAAVFAALPGCSALPVESQNVVLNVESKDFTSPDETLQLTATVEPESAENKTVTWQTSNEAVATVTENGLVTPVANGTTMITARAEGGRGVGGCVIRVNFGAAENEDVPANAADPVPLSDVNFNTDMFTFNSSADQLKLTPVFEPANTTERGLTWSSTDESVATVDANGVVTPVGMGTCTIKALADNKQKVALCDIIVAFTPDAHAFSSRVQTDGEVRAVWVSTVSCIDFPSRPGLDAAQLREQISQIVINAASWGLNTIYFQVRPTADAFYDSKLFPSSNFLVKKQGDALPVDVLQEVITAAHNKGIELHAWINPYRISQASGAGTNLEALAPEHPARKHPDWVVKFDGAMYFNPGIPEVRQLIVGGVEEIVQNYPVDGIHFDDYFYPSGSSEGFDDGAAYQKYGAGMQKDDWRRNNVNLLVDAVHKAVKAIRPSAIFGVSPGGIWATGDYQPQGVPGLTKTAQTYYDNYADSRKWVTEKMVDYICPQIYWQIGHSLAPFKTIAAWWGELCKSAGVPLYVGIAAYKAESVEAFQTNQEIKNELDFLDGISCGGSVFFTYNSIQKNLAGIADTLKARFA